MVGYGIKFVSMFVCCILLDLDLRVVCEFWLVVSVGAFEIWMHAITGSFIVGNQWHIISY